MPANQEGRRTGNSESNSGSRSRESPRGDARSESEYGGTHAAFRDAVPYLGLGLQLGVTMVFFVGVGYVADQWWGSDPWGVLVGAVLGMASMVTQLMRLTGDLPGPSSGPGARSDGRSRDAHRDEE